MESVKLPQDSFIHKQEQKYLLKAQPGELYVTHIKYELRETAYL